MNHFKLKIVPMLIVSLLPSFTSLSAYAQDTNLAQYGNSQQTQQLSKEQISALVAPIALYPDSLVSQVLMASTYPVQVAEAYQWYQQNRNLTGDSLNSALKNQQWDQSVKSIVHFPQVIDMMGSKLDWTQNLGNAVLSQQSAVLAAIQVLRQKAQQNGSLQSNEQQNVQVQGSGSSQVIVIQPANPQVVYVPTYNPQVVYGGWPYPSYPPYTYYPPGYVAGTALLSFGVGMAVGAALWGGCHWGGGGWGGWGGGNSLTINNNTYNNFSRNTMNNWNSSNRFSGTGNWQHNGGAYSGRNFNNSNVSAERANLSRNLQRNGFGSGDRNFGGGERSFGGGSQHFGGGDHSFGGGEHSFGGGSQHFGGGEHSFGGGSQHFGGGDHSFGGGSQHFGGGDHSFGGGSQHFGGGDHSFGGGHSFGGRR